MKKAFLTVLLGLAFCVGMAYSVDESEYYYVNVPIEKIYRHHLGYIVMYQRAYSQMQRVYIPYEWLNEPTGKADQINLSSGNVWPSLTIFYKDGEWSHLRLYVSRYPSHITWGVAPFDSNLDQYFENADQLFLQY